MKHQLKFYLKLLGAIGLLLATPAIALAHDGGHQASTLAANLLFWQFFGRREEELVPVSVLGGAK